MIYSYSKYKKVITPLLIITAFISTVSHVNASANGTNADNINVTIKTEQGGEWFTAREIHTNNNGTIIVKDALPGKYKFLIDNDDQESSQTLGAELRLLDSKGRTIDEKTDIDLSVYIGGVKIPVSTYKTNKDGWLDLAGITHGMIYQIEIDDEMHIEKKDNRPRIKTKAKINNSKWFSSNYQRVGKDSILEIENILTGKYKFKYKNGDVANEKQPFTLRIRVRHNNGKKVKKSTTVKLYAYPLGTKIKIATLKTDHRGWLTLPGVQTGMKYKIKVKD